MDLETGLVQRTKYLAGPYAWGHGQGGRRAVNKELVKQAGIDGKTVLQPAERSHVSVAATGGQERDLELGCQFDLHEHKLSR